MILYSQSVSLPYAQSILHLGIKTLATDSYLYGQTSRSDKDLVGDILLNGWRGHEGRARWLLTRIPQRSERYTIECGAGSITKVPAGTYYVQLLLSQADSPPSTILGYKCSLVADSAGTGTSDRSGLITAKGPAQPLNARISVHHGARFLQLPFDIDLGGGVVFVTFYRQDAILDQVPWPHAFAGIPQQPRRIPAGTTGIQWGGDLPLKVW